MYLLYHKLAQICSKSKIIYYISNY